MEQESANSMTHERFMRLFLQAERELLRYVMTLVPNVHDARDVVQETAFALWRKMDEYDPCKPFVAWACRFALNEARQFLRSEFRKKRLLEEDVAALLESRRLEVAGELDVRRSHLADCLKRLPEEPRELVRSYYFDDESIDSLAGRLSRSKDAVYKALQRVRQALHDCIERKLQTES